tara:strand:- start:179 stop:319 length:141 start_codon:yes stop_codon:yes gene_type:complete
LTNDERSLEERSLLTDGALKSGASSESGGGGGGGGDGRGVESEASA